MSSQAWIQDLTRGAQLLRLKVTDIAKRSEARKFYQMSVILKHKNQHCICFRVTRNESCNYKQLWLRCIPSRLKYVKPKIIW